MTSYTMLGITLLAAVACAHAISPTGDARLGEPFEVRIGGDATIEGEDVALHFIDVPEDSRCPIGVDCIHAGNATVALEVGSRSGPREPVTLNTDDPPGPQAPWRAYLITLVSLTPRPHADRKIQPEEYIARLTVTRR